MNKKVRVRFAPSPTGPLHIGGVRTALYNYLFAKKHGGDFILRIEDTDGNRFVPGAEDYIIKSLKWCGIEPNEGIGFGNGAYGPYRQSERKASYLPYVEKLLNDGNAYYAFDSSAELTVMRNKLMKSGNPSAAYDGIVRMTMKNSLTLSADETKRLLDLGTPYVVRLKMPRNEDVRFHDLIRGWIVVKSDTVDDKVLFKSDGMPTYHLANVVDDYNMKITHVIRGEEWLPSAPLHVMLYKHLGWADDMPEFVHLPLILGPNGKLSKRDGDKYGFPVFPLEWKDPTTGDISNGYRERGYLPEAVVNMIALIGWNPGGNIEAMSMDEMADKFKFEDINKAGGRFDLKKAEWFNKHYMLASDNIHLAKMWMPTIVKNLGREVDLNYVASVCGLLKQKLAYLDKFWELGTYFFIDPTPVDCPDNTKEFLLSFINWMNEMNYSYTSDEVHDAFKNCVAETNTDAREAGKVLRAAITGMAVGPPMFDIIALFGETAYKRIDACLTKEKTGLPI